MSGGVSPPIAPASPVFGDGDPCKEDSCLGVPSLGTSAGGRFFSRVERDGVPSVLPGVAGGSCEMEADDSDAAASTGQSIGVCCGDVEGGIRLLFHADATPKLVPDLCACCVPASVGERPVSTGALRSAAPQLRLLSLIFLFS